MLSERALCSRINRKLAKNGEILKKRRGKWWVRLKLGDYYLLNVYRNSIVEKHVDPWELGVRLKVVSEAAAIQHTCAVVTQRRLSNSLKSPKHCRAIGLLEIRNSPAPKKNLGYARVR